MEGNYQRNYGRACNGCGNCEACNDCNDRSYSTHDSDLNSGCSAGNCRWKKTCCCLKKGKGNCCGGDRCCYVKTKCEWQKKCITVNEYEYVTHCRNKKVCKTKNECCWEKECCYEKPRGNCCGSSSGSSSSGSGDSCCYSKPKGRCCTFRKVCCPKKVCEIKQEKFVERICKPVQKEIWVKKCVKCYKEKNLPGGCCCK